MAQEPVDGCSGLPHEWITTTEAARRLSMSVSSFRDWADRDGIEVVRRGGKPGVNWSSVEAAIAKSRIGRVNGPLLRDTDPELPIHGVDVLDAARGLLGSDGRIARKFGVNPGTVSRWRVDGVPDLRLRQLAEMVGWPAELMPAAGETARRRIVRRRR